MPKFIYEFSPRKGSLQMKYFSNVRNASGYFWTDVKFEFEFFNRLCLNRVHLRQNEFKISKFFEAEAEDESEPESVRQKMFLHFATEVNNLNHF